MLSPAFLLRLFRLLVVSPLLLRMAVHTFFPSPLLYAKWLILVPALSLSGSCRHSTLIICSTLVFSAAMAYRYDLTQLCKIALNVGGSNFCSMFSCNHGPCSRRSSCCGLCRRCFCNRCCALCNSDHFRFHSPILCIGHLLFAPTSLSSMQCSCLHAQHSLFCSWEWSRDRHCPSSWFSCPSHPCLSGDFRLVCAPTSECDVVSFAVWAFLLCVAAERALLCIAPHDVALMGVGAVQPWAVAACWFATAVALYVAPFAAMLTSADWAYIFEWFKLYHTSAPLMPSMTSLRTTLFPIPMMMSEDAEISPLALRFLMLWGFTSHHTWTGITTPSFTE